MKFNTPKTPTDFVVGKKPYAGQVEKPLTARMAYPVAIIMSLVWAGSAVMFAIGYQSRLIFIASGPVWKHVDTVPFMSNSAVYYVAVALDF